MYKRTKIEFNKEVDKYLKDFISMYMCIGKSLSLNAFKDPKKKVNVYSISSSTLSDVDLYSFNKGWLNSEEGDVKRELFHFIDEGEGDFTLYSEDFNLRETDSILGSYHSLAKLDKSFIHVLNSYNWDFEQFKMFYRESDTFHFSIIKSSHMSNPNDMLSDADLNSIVENMRLFICSAYDNQGFLVFKVNEKD